jgi:hypothetical protein
MSAVPDRRSPFSDITSRRGDEVLGDGASLVMGAEVMKIGGASRHHQRSGITSEAPSPAERHYQRSGVTPITSAQAAAA